MFYFIITNIRRGKISDSSGKIVDFSNTIIVMTTNVGSETTTSSVMGFNKDKDNATRDITTSVKKHFPADLLNRIDEVIPFNPLKEDQIKIIIDKELHSFSKELSDKKIEIIYTKKISDYVYDKIQFNNFGARQVLKTLQREIQTLVAEKILDEPRATQMKVCVRNDKVCVI